eukprot:scaffold45238_cov19-Tisochrysis_lutea.AAC.2
MRAYIDALKERQGIGSLPALPHGLAPVLRALCVHSTPKVAKLAAFALAGAGHALEKVELWSWSHLRRLSSGLDRVG